MKHNNFLWISFLLLANTALAAPANDNLSAARDITQTQQASGVYVNATTIIGSTIGATLEPGEPAASVTHDAGHTVWYKWTAPVSGKFTLSTRDTNNVLSEPLLIFPNIVIYTSSVPNPTTFSQLIKFAEAYEEGYQARADLDVVQGKTYYMSLDISGFYNDGTPFAHLNEGNFVVNIKTDNVFKADMNVNFRNSYNSSEPFHLSGFGSNNLIYYRVTNTGPSDVRNVKVRFDLGQATYIAYNDYPFNQGNCTPEGTHIVNCDIFGIFYTGVPKELTSDFKVFIPNQLMTSVNITATVSSPDYTELAPANNTVSATYIVPSAQQVPMLGDFGFIIFAGLMSVIWAGFMRKNKKVQFA